ncbi:MAG: hypothetical protein ABIQ09_17165 [Jatrophihabitantaceae bacterium]
MPRVIVGFGLLVGRPAWVGGAGFEGFTTVLVGFADGVASGSVRVGVGAGVLLAGGRGMTCDDDVAGPPTGVVRAGADVGSAELGAGELAGALLGDAEILDCDGRAVAPADGPLGAAARWSGPGVELGPGDPSGPVAGESITMATTTAATTNPATAASAITAPLIRVPESPRPDCAARAGT